MIKKIFIAGILGGITLMILTFLVNGLMRFNVSINMKQIGEEQQVYEILRETIVEPGRYVCNPQVTSAERYPEGEPVFSILYGGVGHEAAGSLMLIGLFIYILSPIIGAWLLSQTSDKVLNSYGKKVLFFAAIGLLIALFSDLTRYGIGDYPLGDALILGINHIITWTLVGLVIAWVMKPKETIDIKQKLP